MTHINLCIIRRRERKGGKKLFEYVMAENLPNLKKQTDIQE